MADESQHVGVYVDGFNLYYGMKEEGYRKLYWLDLLELSKRVTLPHQEVVYVKYFTSRISGPKPSDSAEYRTKCKAKVQRQADYIDALKTHIPILAVYEGQFLTNNVTCRHCKKSWSNPQEKMTDVNIATELLIDTYADRYDTALLISGDSDLVPPIKAVRAMFPHKRLIVAFPPARPSVELKNVANGQFTLSKGHLKKSQLPDEIKNSRGQTFRRPESWK